LARDYEVYHCLAGDTDDFIELTHWRGGKIDRQLTGDIRFLKFGKDVGTPFKCESWFTTDEARQLDWQGRTLMLAVAEELGVDIDHRHATIRAYEIKSGWKMD